ncbi:MAG TPA: 2OG-Fe(II) oxygenase [Solimonas sp.]|nr:2OG-Fe(II) oxygenase [Solimonas sp.]
MTAPDWAQLRGQLDAEGVALLPGLLDGAQCADLRGLYDQPERFRSRIQMERYRFGRGEYQYFAAPLPSLVQALRETVYAQLLPLANDWAQRLGETRRYPETHAQFVAQCHAAGQGRPTPLLLRYRTGDYNCLHQDLYGALAFPLQLVVLLSEPGVDFEGGELALTEQRPRAQSRLRVLPLRRGDAAVFAVHQRPVQGSRGSHRVQLRHGVSTVTRGERLALGVIFHDAS